eukprot:3066675-Pyramimonas_sp.AAC.2
MVCCTCGVCPHPAPHQQLVCKLAEQVYSVHRHVNVGVAAGHYEVPHHQRPHLGGLASDGRVCEEDDLSAVHAGQSEIRRRVEKVYTAVSFSTYAKVVGVNTSCSQEDAVWSQLYPSQQGTA